MRTTFKQYCTARRAIGITLIASLIITIGYFSDNALAHAQDAAPAIHVKQGFVDDGPYVSHDPTAPFSEVRDYMTGGANNAYAFAITKAGMRHTVLNVGVRELVSVDTSTGKTKYIKNSLESRIANAVKWNEAHPNQKLTVHIRFHVGKSAPDAWKKMCGTVNMIDPQFNVGGAVPRWWVKNKQGDYTYRILYVNAMDQLASAVASINQNRTTHGIVGSVNIPGAAPNYPEPMIIYSAAQSVRTNLIRAGFTPREHNLFMDWLPKTAAKFTNVAVELAVNPYQNVAVNGSPIYSDGLKYQSMGNALIAAIGNRAVLANYSARSSYIGIGDKKGYGQMYAWMRDKVNGNPKVWAGVQMARPKNVADSNSRHDPEQWDNVAMWAANQGFHFVETTGPGRRSDARVMPSSANVWPLSYNDDRNDITDMLSIGRNFADNTKPW